MRGARRWIGLAVWIALPLLAGWIGSQFQPGAWYSDLDKPSWNPPSWVFGPVWTILYILMGVAAWLVWERHGADAILPLGVFTGQLVLNAAWSWLFFGQQSPGMALVDIIVLWALIVLTTVLFWRARRAAGLLLLPYLAWVSFATALNLAIWRLNA